MTDAGWDSVHCVLDVGVATKILGGFEMLNRPTLTLIFSVFFLKDQLYCRLFFDTSKTPSPYQGNVEVMGFNYITSIIFKFLYYFSTCITPLTYMYYI